MRIQKPTFYNHSREMVWRTDEEWARNAIDFWNNGTIDHSLWQQGSVWETVGQSWMERYIPALDSGDAETLIGLMRNFFRNELSTGLVSHYSRYKDDNQKDILATISRDLNVLLSQHEIKYLETIELPCVGNPWGMSIGSVLIAPDNPRHFSRAVMLDGIAQNSERERPIIFEIGGGYGGVPFFINSWRGVAKRGLYVICDIEPVLLIASYFLQASGKTTPGNLKVALVTLAEEPIREPEARDVSIMLVPASMRDKLDFQPDVVYNANSFSEMSGEECQRWWSTINKMSPKHIFLQANYLTLNIMGHACLPLCAFGIDERYTVSDWRYSPWSAGVGLVKEVLYVRND